MSNGSISKLGGYVDNLGNNVPIASGVYLNRVGIGLCINPPPFKLRGDVGVTVFPTPKENLLNINGHILYTDAFNEAVFERLVAQQRQLPEKEIKELRSIASRTHWLARQAADDDIAILADISRQCAENAVVEGLRLSKPKKG